MKNKLNETVLREFEKHICDNYGQGKIRAPVHLCGGNERQLIEIFERVDENDWVFSTHRSHYHSLLKSQDIAWVRKEIFNKRSSHINSKKHKIFTSAIVGGCVPIALGVALALKLKKSKRKAWCFVGDMASEMGIFNECLKYAYGHSLPITYVIENNGLGVNTPTGEVWGKTTDWIDLKDGKLDGYSYKRTYPHYGVLDKDGKKAWINF